MREIMSAKLLIWEGVCFFLLHSLVAGETVRIDIENAWIAAPTELKIAAKAIDEFGEPQSVLDKKRYSLTIDQQPVSILTVQPALAAYPLWIGLVMDVSGSMKGEPLADAQQAAIQFVNSLEPQDQGILIAFSDSVRLLQNFTDNKSALKQGIISLTAHGETSLHDAIYDAIQILRPIPALRKAVVVLSDGEDNRSSVTLEDCISYAQNSRVPVYTIGFGDKLNPLQFRRTLGRLSKLTRAVSYYASQPRKLFHLYDLIARQLKSQVLITAAFPTSLNDGKAHEIKLQVNLAYAGATGFARVDFPASQSQGSQEIPPDRVVVIAAGLFGGVIIIIGFILGLIFISKKFYHMPSSK